ncbi:MAG TPA: hypothetical protein VFE62_25560 [Gemmataceae bacterium]|nr:hypothetical protein [Gemmataceae bacterium]
MEIPELRIEVIDGQFVAVLDDAKVPLPAPTNLKQDAIEICRSTGEEEAAEALATCTLSYAVALGEGIEQMIEIVIAAPDGVFATLQDDGNPVTSAVMGALIEVCPDFESSRVVRLPEKRDK